MIKKYSKNKWNLFSDKKKIRILKDSFLELENSLINNTICIDILDFYKGIDELLRNEINPLLIKLKSNIGKLILEDNNDRAQLKQNALELYNILRQCFNYDLVSQKDFHFLPIISKIDKEKNNEKLPIIIILDNLRSAFNVGGIFRTSECLNIEEVWLCGYTPTPNKQNVKNTAMGTEERVSWKFFAETKVAILEARRDGYKVYSIETVPNAISLYNEKFSGKVCFVFGNEALGISMENILLSDLCLQLPLSGWKNSLNVASCCAVVCFEVYRQYFS